MNTRLIGELIRLRYKLMWAKTRTRNGKIAMFMVGYTLMVLVIALFAAGGFGAAALAVRSGRTEMITRLALTSLFLQALFTTVLMGFGLGAIFSDVELRRYPVTAAERRLVRHLIGIIDPFWALTLALYFGLVIGLYVMGAASFWMGLVAVLLLIVANYLVARIFEIAVGRMMQGPAGSTVLLVFVLALSFSGALIPPLLKRFPGLGDAAAAVFSWTPPFGAAAAMVHGTLGGIGLELVWLAALIGVLVAFENRPPQRRTVETTALSFESFYDRFAAALGFQNGPLVAWWLRYYGRNGRFKAMMVLTLPLTAFLTFNLGGQKQSVGWFVAAMGTFPVSTFVATSRFMVNQFGHLGGGYRRCFLLPVTPGDVLAAGSCASLVFSAACIPPVAIAWALFAPVPFDARQLVMLLASAITGLFVFHALGLWTSIYGPRKGEYNQSFGNDLSLLGRRRDGRRVGLPLHPGGVGEVDAGTFRRRELVDVDRAAWRRIRRLPDVAPRRVGRPARETGALDGHRGGKGLTVDAIRISNLVKKYGTVLAVDDLSLAVPKGSMFGFLGPNGSGKSTTIGCLTGLLDPTAGKIEILGERFTADSSALKRRMGVMPETLGLFDQLYAHEFWRSSRACSGWTSRPLANGSRSCSKPSNSPTPQRPLPNTAPACASA